MDYMKNRVKPTIKLQPDRQAKKVQHLSLIFSAIGSGDEEGRSCVTYEQNMQKLKEVLDKGWPVAVGGLCGKANCDQPQKGGHAVMVTGYRKVCKCKIGPNCKDTADNCIESLRILNTWGEEFQKSKIYSDDGWVEAKRLLKNISSPNKTQGGRMSWLMPPKPPQ